MANLIVKKIFKSIGLFKAAVFLKRKVNPVLRAFYPLTPHLLLAVERSLEWIQQNRKGSGDYLEFGIFRGFTFWYAQACSKQKNIQNMRFFGFDSFFGLPEIKGLDKNGDFQEGLYYSPRHDVEGYLNEYGVDWNKTVLVEGWFDKTLTNETRQKNKIVSAALVVIDCDLYESTVPVMNFLQPLIGEEKTIILFDDWNSFGASDQKGERKAFKEFLDKNPAIKCEAFIQFGPHGQGFLVWKQT
jgi:O-methyltransferase